jgi:HEPN domain-containing protein
LLSLPKNTSRLLEEIGVTVPKTHDLTKLLNDLLSHHPTLRSVRRGAGFLTTFAVATRYPGDDANRRQAKAALRWADKMRAVARTLLGLP